MLKNPKKHVASVGMALKRTDVQLYMKGLAWTGPPGHTERGEVSHRETPTIGPAGPGSSMMVSR